MALRWQGRSWWWPVGPGRRRDLPTQRHGLGLWPDRSDRTGARRPSPPLEPGRLDRVRLLPPPSSSEGWACTWSPPSTGSPWTGPRPGVIADKNYDSKAVGADLAGGAGIRTATPHPQGRAPRGPDSGSSNRCARSSSPSRHPQGSARPRAARRTQHHRRLRTRHPA